MRTIIYETHKELGAKIVDFHGFDMPVYYSSIKEEHFAVRNYAGLFDVSHMGEFLISGSDAEKFLNFIFTNDFKDMPSGKARYSLMLNEKGGVVDDIIAYKLSSNKFLIIVNASNIEKDFNHIQKYAIGFDITLKNESADYSLIALQGPKASEIIFSFFPEIQRLKFFEFKKEKYLNGEIIIARTGYTGEAGYEIMCLNDAAPSLFNEILKKDKNILPCGLGARDTLRLEAALPLYGHEFDEGTTPADAGFLRYVKKDGEFIGKEGAFAASKKLVPFESKGAPPRAGYKVFSDGKEKGKVTSGSPSPSLNKNIGFAYTALDFNKNHFFIEIRNKFVHADIVKIPFISKNTK